jgi:ribonuclease R
VNPEGVIIETLGAADEPCVDMLSFINKFELPEAFPAGVEDEARAIPTAIPREEIKNREDFRNDFVLTIDPDDAKDFDDALSYRTHPNGDLEVFVHIADVSTYVRPGTALDREASARANSVYLVDRVIPMLPEKLSNGICSLQPGVDRLVKTAIMRLNRKGDAISHRFASGIIHSKQRLTYKQAMALLRKPDGSEVAKQLTELNRMARLLRKKRFDRGALDLDFPEFKVRLDELGKPVKVERIENDESHQLIEEYMLLANETVARELRRRQFPAVYRIHENPDPARLEDFRAQLKCLGFSVGNLSQRGEVQKLLLSIRGKKEEPVIKVNLLKSLRRAMYSVKALGHFGLAKENYTHFTSPIRRYADLIVHRVLFNTAAGGVSAGPGRLEEMILQMNLKEKNASDAENESVKLKKLEYFSMISKQTKKPSFCALLLEVKSFGLLVELPEFQVQGLVQISDIKGDIFYFDNQRLEMRGQKTRKVYRAGQEIMVEAEKVDLFKRQINFSTRAD